MNKKELLARMAPEKSLPPAVAKEKTTALSQLGPLERRYAAIKVTDEKSCQQMDSLLGDVVQARKGWGSIWARIHEKSIKPIMDGVNALHEVNRAIDGPLGKLEDAGKKAIKTFRVSEQARITRAREEEEALNRKSEELQSKAEAARTLLQRGKILAQKEIIDTQAVRAFEAATPVQTENTGNRTKPAWRLVGSEVESGRTRRRSWWCLKPSSMETSPKARLSSIPDTSMRCSNIDRNSSRNGQGLRSSMTFRL